MSRDLFGFDQPLRRPDSGEFVEDFIRHAETKDSILVSLDGDESKAKWLPKRKLDDTCLIDITKLNRTDRATKRDGQTTVLPVVTVKMPMWLAVRDGFT